MNKEKIIKFFSEAGDKTLVFLNKALAVIKKHKALTAIAASVLVITFCVTFWVMDKLDRINYNDGRNPVALYTDSTVSSTTLPTSQAITGLVSQDGSLVFFDGSYINILGAVVLRDGTTIYPTGIIVFRDGSFLQGSGIKIGTDGVATLKNGSTVHITNMSIQSDGRIVTSNADGSLKVLGSVVDLSNNYYSNNSDYNNNGGITNNVQPVTQPTTSSAEDNFEELMQNANSDIQQQIQQNDALIEENAHNNEIWYSRDVINILLMGIDYGGKNYPYGRSDAMIVASINKKTKSVKLVSLARVTYAAIEGFSNTRLSHAHGYGGPLLAMQTVEKNFKIKIDNYISVTFDGFKKIIDAFGGVDINLTKEEVKDETMIDVLSWQGYKNPKAGTYTLNGTSALNYARLRSIDSDRQRTSRQRTILTALANKARTMNVFQLNNLLNEILPNVTTDLAKTEIVGQMFNVPAYLSNTIEQDVLPNKYGNVEIIDGFGVAFVDWKTEVKYAHDLLYTGVDVQYMIG